MYDPFSYSKKRSVVLLYLLIVVNSISILLAGLFLPPLTGILGLLFGFYLYYLTYAVPAKNSFWREVRLFVVAVTGVSLGTLLLWLSCGYTEKAVCNSPNQLEAQIFISFAFTLPFLLLSWLFYRLPMLINGKRRTNK